MLINYKYLTLFTMSNFEKYGESVEVLDSILKNDVYWSKLDNIYANFGRDSEFAK